MNQKNKNRLGNSNSPYLLQHADNPVDWYEWEPEAFRAAKEQKRLIFLSIGYSTCHWCHVMERESFESDDVAQLLNSSFISIKVDREQRPDIDQVYMEVCQALTGSGGWPLTIIMTPEKKPVFAGTYFPRRQKHGRPGLMEILAKVAALWQTSPETLLNSAREISDAFRTRKDFQPGPVKEELVEHGIAQIAAAYDPVNGGFSSAPKFPAGHLLDFLLSYSYKKNDQDLLARVEHTLQAMYKGGIFDHIGGGFCRYSTDAEWFAPHFEKMLYDNSLLLNLYAKAHKITGRLIYKEVAEDTANYILRDLGNEEGGFFSAEDADSEGEEGKFYLFTSEEFCELADDDFKDVFLEYFSLKKNGNFENGRNILHLAALPKEFVERKCLDYERFIQRLNDFRQKLFAYREKRVRPALDDKIITSWNGMAIGALANAGRLLDNKDFIEKAQNTASFIKKNLCDSDSKLYHCWRKQKATDEGFFEDYAFLIRGLLDLFRADQDLKWLEWVVQLDAKAEELFSGEKPGKYFENSHDSEELFFRPENIYDGAMPSARSIYADAVLTLYHITGQSKYLQKVENILAANSELITEAPWVSVSLLKVLLRFFTQEARLVVESGDKKIASEAVEILDNFEPFDSTVMLIKNNDDGKLAAGLSDNELQMPDPEHQQLQLCIGDTCLKPAKNIEDFKAVLHSLKK
ncbi:MAG: thioredoxin domain-containing protein [Candidatus Rifleibacteriota bacterium]